MVLLTGTSEDCIEGECTCKRDYKGDCITEISVSCDPASTTDICSTTIQDSSCITDDTGASKCTCTINTEIYFSRCAPSTSCKFLAQVLFCLNL